MPTWAKSTARNVLLTASFVALGASAFPGGAYADTSGNSSVLGGNQINAPISAPIDASGNALAIGGVSNAGSKGGATVVNKGDGNGGRKTSGNSSVGGGNQVNAPISAPINACGNAVAIFGTADAGCKGGATVINKGGGHGKGQKTSGNSSVGGGNQINAPISAPVNACGNAVAIFGSAEAGCKGGAEVINKGIGGGGQKTSGDHSVLGGNQIHAPVSTPINICGNAAGLFGKAVAGCKGGASVKNGGGHGGHYGHKGHGKGQHTSGNSSVGGGNQINAPISAPVNVCGNGAAECEGGAEVVNKGGGHGKGQKTSGDHSVLGGNQVHAPVSVPVSVCGNAVAVLGHAAAFCEGGAHVHNGSPANQHTSGDSSVGGGNQVNAPISAPITICGNAIAVLGVAMAGCEGGSSVENGPGPGHYTSHGTQVNAPSRTPVKACGNVGTVLGKNDPNCDNDHGYRQNQALPVSPAGALPALPALPGLPVIKGLPVSTDKLPGGLPVKLPTSPSDAVAALQAKGNSLPVKGLPLNAVEPLPALPVGANNGAVQIPGKTLALPNERERGAKGTDLPELPVVSEMTLPVGGQQIPSLGGVQKVSAQSPLTDDLNGGSLYVLGVGAMLAAVSGAMAFARRLARR